MSLSDGFHLLSIYKAYLHSTKVLQSRFIEVNTSAMNCLLAEAGFRSNIKAIIGLIKLVFKSAIPKESTYPNCDVILFNSSNKGSFGPSMQALSERLSNRGFRCAMLSYTTLTLYELGEVKCVYGIPGFHRARNLYSAIFSLLIGACLLVQVLFAAKHSREVFFHILKRTFPTWLHLSYSQIRILEANNFLSLTGARILLTHIEKIPVANELVMVSKQKKIYSIFYCCEHPDALLAPIFSNEVWVWNRSIGNSVANEVIDNGIGNHPDIKVVGHHESDLIIERMKSSIDLDLPNQLSQKKIFIFISEYVKNKTWQRGPPTKICVEWLSIAANALPEWLFIFKGRPYQSLADVPGFDSPKDLPSNLILYQGAMSLQDLLSSGMIAAAGALGSLGLFAAAQSGIPSFRFKVTEVNMSMPFLDELTLMVGDPKALVDKLKDLELSIDILNEKLLNLPYRGKSLDQMEALACKHLLP